MYKENELYPLGFTDDTYVWRYMELWKFLDLISSGTLYFSKVADLGDLNELLIPQKAYESWLSWEEDEDFPKESRFIENRQNTLLKLRQEMSINCWFVNKNESFAMWKMYAKDKTGVAIKTTLKRLKDCFKFTTEEIKIGQVEYQNFSRSYSISALKHPILIKNSIYEYEQEIRCVNRHSKNQKIAVDINVLLENVYISFFAEENGIKDFIEYLKDNKGLNFQIKTSNVSDSWL